MTDVVLVSDDSDGEPIVVQHRLGLRSSPRARRGPPAAAIAPTAGGSTQLKAFAAPKRTRKGTSRAEIELDACFSSYKPSWGNAYASTSASTSTGADGRKRAPSPAPGSSRKRAKQGRDAPPTWNLPITAGGYRGGWGRTADRDSRSTSSESLVVVKDTLKGEGKARERTPAEVVYIVNSDSELDDSDSDDELKMDRLRKTLALDLDLDPNDAGKARRWWKGAILHCSSTSTGHESFVSFNEIMGPKAQLGDSILSSMSWLPKHLLEHLPSTHTSLWMAAEETHKSIQSALPSFVRQFEVQKPEGETRICHHAKFMILFFKTFCRIVISTANLTHLDWLHADNTVYVHDFPHLPPEKISEPSEPKHAVHSPFSTYLFVYLRHAGLKNSDMRSLGRYDYSSSSLIRLVCNMPGIAMKDHNMFVNQDKDDLSYRSGVVSLSDAVRELRRPGTSNAPGDKWIVELHASSIGGLKEELVRQILTAVTGKRVRKFKPAYDMSVAFDWSPFELRVPFPTREYVEEARRKQPGAGSCHMLSETSWHSSRFKHLFHSLESKRSNNAVIHAKSIAVKRIPAVGAPEAFVYVGSANVSLDAWGLISQPKSSTEPRMSHGNNFEMGVLVRVPGTTDAELEKGISERVMYKRPLQRYGPGDVPWLRPKKEDRRHKATQQRMSGRSTSGGFNAGGYRPTGGYNPIATWR